LSDLAIDPQVEGDKQKLIAYLTETLRKEMCGVADRSTCYESLLRFTNEYEIPDFRYKKEFLSDIIREQIARRVNKDRVTSVLVKNELTFDQEQKVRDWNLAGVYPNENGLYVNPEELMRPDIFANNYKELF